MTMESSVSTPFAVPYPWTVSERQASQIQHRKRKMGSGLAYLYNSCNISDNSGASTSTMSSRAVHILKDLIGPATRRTRTRTSYEENHDGDEAEDSVDDGLLLDSAATQMQASIYFSMGNLPQVFPPLPSFHDEEENVDSDLHIVTLAQNGEISLLLQILKSVDDYVQQKRQQQVIDHDDDDHDTADQDVEVPTKLLIQTCALCVNPCKTPGMMDAEDMVLAALKFLSSSGTWHGTCSAPTRNKQSNDKQYNNNDDDQQGNRNLECTISLPLLEPNAQHQNGADAQSYRKVGHWRWKDFQTRTFGEVQLAFDSSPIRREAFVPRFVVSDADEAQLLQKGVVPPSAAPKRKGPAPGFRKK